jgi:hypothetical protein
MMNNSRYMVKTQINIQKFGLFFLEICVVVFCAKRSSFSWTSAQIWLGKHKRNIFFHEKSVDMVWKTKIKHTKLGFFCCTQQFADIIVGFMKSWFLFYPTKCGISMNTCRYNLVLLFHYISRLISNYKSNMLGYYLPQN